MQPLPAYGFRIKCSDLFSLLLAVFRHVYNIILRSFFGRTRFANSVPTNRSRGRLCAGPLCSSGTKLICHCTLTFIQVQKLIMCIIFYVCSSNSKPMCILIKLACNAQVINLIIKNHITADWFMEIDNLKNALTKVLWRYSQEGNAQIHMAAILQRKSSVSVSVNLDA